MEILWQTAFHEEKTRRQVQIIDRLWRHLYLQARCTRLSILYYTFSSVSCLHRRQRTAPTSEFVGASFCLGCCRFFRKPPLPICFTCFRFCKRGKNDENTWNHMETHGKYACLGLLFWSFFLGGALPLWQVRSILYEIVRVVITKTSKNVWCLIYACELSASSSRRWSCEVANMSQPSTSRLA